MMHKELLYSKLLVESVRSKSTGEFHYVYVVISEEKPNYFYVGKHSTDNLNDKYQITLYLCPPNRSPLSYLIK